MHEHTPDTSPSRGGSRSLRARRWSFSLFASLALLATAGCDDDETETPPPPPAAPKYTANIKRTSYGIPHITANDYGSLGFGQGYAFAQDHVCTLADQILKVRSERARFLGQGPGNTYVASDLAYLSMGLLDRAAAAFPTVSEEMQAMLTGYAAGYNKYLADTAPAARPAECANAPWVRPITPVELLAYNTDLTLIAGVNALALTIAAAMPPTVGAQSFDAKQAALRPQMPTLEDLQRLRRADFGSNGWAIGAERTDNGKGMVMANPHFPWEGELRLWESQLTVPGQLNVYGVGLMGVPAVLIGFNENVAWTHTFSSGQRMTMYQLQLVPGKPTVYKYGNEERAMTSKTFTILVKLAEGSVTNYTQTMYFSHYGPIIAIPDSAAPGFPAGTLGWNTQTVLTLRDGNIDNTKFLDQFHGMNKAKNLAEFKDVYATQQGLPWVNTMYADKEGKAWYTDATPTPNLTKDAYTKWLTEATTGTNPIAYGIYSALGFVLLNGSDPANEWQVEPGSRSPGLVPFAKVPKLDRNDFVFNANDSYWLSNPEAPLTGFSPLHGLEKVPQSPRTRMNVITLTESGPNAASGPDHKFSLDELKTAVFSNRSSMEELVRASVVERCAGKTTITYQNTAVDISQACTLLKDWNGRYDTGAKGAFVFREFLGAYSGPNLLNAGQLFATPFDPANPITTPNTLVPAPAQGDDPVLVKLAQAVYTINRSGVALDKTLGEVQFTARAGANIPLQGGMGREGITNVVSYGVARTTLFDYAEPHLPTYNATTLLSRTGYPINNGSSFVMAMQFTDAGPTGNAVLTYGQSGDPTSAHYADQTRLFSQKQWRPILFTAAQISGDANLVETNVSGG
ncbi:penicillin acylase family protein [Corallococcus sp. Z5C101001]|uniref:penicillin acylase family protein n=1 Tax=Corallococcus sp. Z5C101001 TaxID=2596829 RepID=UPI0011813D88|nr:penicillin acylase family protein [Corallococcus sp. Z5C101001]TSC31699.1 acylase [Corallococcus sp. Z5C101001]